MAMISNDWLPVLEPEFKKEYYNHTHEQFNHSHEHSIFIEAISRTLKIYSFIFYRICNIL